MKSIAAISLILCPFLIGAEAIYDLECDFEFNIPLEHSSAYIDKHKKTAVKEMKRTGIPASIKMAQAILESNWGRSTLAVKAKNHFGIKCHSSWKGKTYHIKDDDRDRNGNLIKSCFRVYDNANKSFIAHSEFLKDNPRYHHLFNYPKTDYKKWARGLKKAGYATSPTYDRKLIRIIEDYGLHIFDEEEEMILVINTPTVPSTGKDKDKINNPPRPGKKPGKKDKKKDYFKYKKINKTNAVVLKKDMKVKDIARLTGISVKELKLINDWGDQKIIAKKENVFLKTKQLKYKGDKKYHLVIDEQSMHYIAQRYGIQLQSLYAMNNMVEGEEPARYANVRLKKKKRGKPKLR